MADSLTANYDLVKPEVGASGNTWGGKTNANWDSVDSLINAIDVFVAASKTTPILADKVGIIDTETDPDTLKVITLTQLKALLLAALSVSDSIFEIIDNADGTKKLQFQLSGITTGTTRTLTIPNLSGTIALIAGDQTLSDKTIILKQGTAELPTAEGDVRWDTDDNVLVIGDGASTKVFVAIPSGMAANDLLVPSGAKVIGRLAVSTLGKVLRLGAGPAPAWGGAAPDVILEDRKAQNTGGGGFSSGAWQTRDLNTEVRDAFGVMTLLTNQFTPSVSGWVEWSAPAFRVVGHQTRLFNVTDGVAVSSGTTESSDNGDFSTTRSNGGGAVVAGKTYRIEHRCTNSNASDGFGKAANIGEEIYTRVEFWVT